MAQVGLAAGVALALSGCRMDNPAFDRGDGDARSTGDELVGDGDRPESESGSESESESESESGAESESESESESGSSETSDGDCPPGVVCPVCHTCNADGDCVPAVGDPCEGPATSCDELLYGWQGGGCHLLAANELPASCNEQGQCKAPPPSACPHEPGDVIGACDEACLIDPDGCSPYLPAGDVDFAAICVLDGGHGPGCTSQCQGSNIVVAGCFEGECVSEGPQPCNGYACNVELNACELTCGLDIPCAIGFECSDGVCF
jgi:hypothetical protein